MDFKLIVTEHFGSYQPGDEITDADAIALALKDNPSHVVKVAVSASTTNTPTA